MKRKIKIKDGLEKEIGKDKKYVYVITETKGGDLIYGLYQSSKQADEELCLYNNLNPDHEYACHEIVLDRNCGFEEDYKKIKHFLGEKNEDK